MALLQNRRVRTVLFAGFLLSGFNIAFETVFALWAYTPLNLGGLEQKVRYV